MAHIKIKSIVIEDSVYVKLDDVIKTQYEDFTNTDNSIIQQYIKSSIEYWEEHQERILNKAKK